MILKVVTSFISRTCEYIRCLLGDRTYLCLLVIILLLNKSNNIQFNIKINIRYLVIYLTKMYNSYLITPLSMNEYDLNQKSVDLYAINWGFLFVCLFGVCLLGCLFVCLIVSFLLLGHLSHVTHYKTIKILNNVNRTGYWTCSLCIHTLTCLKHYLCISYQEFTSR